MSLTSHDLRSLLQELNDALLLEGAEPVDWIVCGGAALALQGFGGRATRDVDVLGAKPVDRLEIVPIGGFSPAVERAIARVATAHPELRGLGPRWVNLGVQKLLEFGLPVGIESRLTPVRFGERLTVHLLGRVDLIALKLFAAADDLGTRQAIHFDDLRRLEPSSAEIEQAIRWIERVPDSHHRIRPSLKRIVEELGHDDLAYYL